MDEGESVSTTMVFELPDKAIALVLEDSNGSRLSLGKEHHSGDLVVFPSPTGGTPVIKRVVAVGGQHLEVQDAVLYVDSSPVAEPFVDLATIGGTYYPRSEVPVGTVFVMGDNRERSIDSRDYGPVPLEGIDGLVLESKP